MKTLIRRLTPLLSAVAFTPLSLRAQPAARGASHVDTLDLGAVPKGARWRVVGRTVSVVTEKNKRALHVSEGPGIGIVWLDGYDFQQGTIDVDLLGRSKPVQGSFIGIAFGVRDLVTHEAIYFRPFNFAGRDSASTAHAVQYVSEPQWSWERLRAEHPGRYESGIRPLVDGDQWFHARLVISEQRVQVYVNGATQPTLEVDRLGDHRRGPVGLWVGNNSGGYFANLQVGRATATK